MHVLIIRHLSDQLTLCYSRYYLTHVVWNMQSFVIPKKKSIIASHLRFSGSESEDKYRGKEKKHHYCFLHSNRDPFFRTESVLMVEKSGLCVQM